MASKRPALPKASEDMKRWSALLLDEIQLWPGTRIGNMFGLISVYRGDAIFALLPRTRAFELPNAIATKMHGAPSANRGKWQSFSIHSDAELGRALKQLSRAYHHAEQ